MRRGIITKANPFRPMTAKLLKTNSRANQDPDPTIKSTDLPAVFENQNPKAAMESYPQHTESNQSNLGT